MHHLSARGLTWPADAVYKLPMSGPGAEVVPSRMPRSHQVVLSVYLAGCAAWLVLGVLPTLANSCRRWSGRCRPPRPAADPSRSTPNECWPARWPRAAGRLGPGVPVQRAQPCAGSAVDHQAAGRSGPDAAGAGVHRHGGHVQRGRAMRSSTSSASPGRSRPCTSCSTSCPGSRTCGRWCCSRTGDCRSAGASRRSQTRLLAVGVTAAVALVCWRSSFIAHPPFFVAFFGVLVPLAGVIAQSAAAAHRSRRHVVGAVAVAAGGPAARLGRGRGVAGGEGLATSAVDLAVGHRISAAVQSLFPALFAVVPVVMFIAILRHRLWDIDVIASKSCCSPCCSPSSAVVYVGSPGPDGVAGCGAAAGRCWCRSSSWPASPSRSAPRASDGATGSSSVPRLSPRDAVRRSSTGSPASARWTN